MPHIALPEGVSGIVSGFAFRPETARPGNEIVDAHVRDPQDLNRYRRRAAMIAIDGYTASAVSALQTT